MISDSTRCCQLNNDTVCYKYSAKHSDNVQQPAKLHKKYKKNALFTEKTHKFKTFFPKQHHNAAKGTRSTGESICSEGTRGHRL